jgi:hypothetical protein
LWEHEAGHGVVGGDRHHCTENIPLYRVRRISDTEGLHIRLVEGL